MNKKAALITFSVFGAATAVTGLALLINSYLNKQSVKDDNKVQYYSFIDDSDKFIYEEIA